MKKIILILSVTLIPFLMYSQEHVIKLNVNEIAFGKYEISYERTFNEGITRTKPSGRLARPFSNKSIQLKNKVWPNIMTKSSLNMTVGMLYKNKSQTFGEGLTAKDIRQFYPNGNPNPNYNDDVSITRSINMKQSGFIFDLEYRTYFKTFFERIGDPPRGFYFAPCLRFVSVHEDFDDLTDSSANYVINALINHANNTQAQGLGAEWHDVSRINDWMSLGGGIVIGRQWLIKNRLSIDAQTGMFYNIFVDLGGTYNGNDTWNTDGVYGVGNNWQTKFIDVYNIDDNEWDPERLSTYFDIVNPDGSFIPVRNKGNAESELWFSNDYHREIQDGNALWVDGFGGSWRGGITDFAKWYTYRIKVRLGWAF